MKKILFFALALLALVACSKFDDSAIWEELNKHEDRIVKLETLCNQMNTNITSLQTIIIALQSNDYVVNIAPIMEGNKEIGYTITFAKSGSITIYHGKDGKDGANGADGKDGQNGTDGKDGKDGYTPKIGVKQHTDGRYYWTLDGTWLLDDNGNMIPATGEDGKDGANGSDGKDGQNGEDGTNGADGKDGITPQLKIEDGYWYLSYDNGATWQKLGKATGNNGVDGLPGADGADGEDGDSIIDSITQDDENVYFNLSDGQIITLPKASEKIIIFSDINTKLICLENWDINGDCEISQSEAAKVTSLNNVFKGSSIIMFNELKYFTGLTELEEHAFKNCSNLKYIVLPKQLTTINSYAFEGCSSLKSIKLSEAITELGDFIFLNSGLESIEFSATVSKLPIGTFKNCGNLRNVSFSSAAIQVIGGEPVLNNGGFSDERYGNRCESSNGAFYGCSSLTDLKLPSTIITIEEGAFWGCSSLKNINLHELTNLETIEGGRYYFSTNISTRFYCGAFTKCTSLETITLPSSLKTIGSGIFGGCNSSLKIYISSSIPCEAASGAFHQLQANSGSWDDPDPYFSIYVPASAVADYKKATNWKSSTIYGY